MKVHETRKGGLAQCGATVKPCPLKNLEEPTWHPELEYDSVESARADFESHLERKYENINGSIMTTKESSINQAKNDLKNALAKGIDFTDDQITVRKKALEYTLKKEEFKNMDTYIQYHNEKTGLWSAERAAIHEEITQDVLQFHKNVPREGKAVISGGLGGAGKSTVLEKFSGYKESDYITVNPDSIKEIMAKKGYIPEVDGFTPMEVSTLVHEEASHISGMIFRRAAKENRNIIVDITMGSVSSVEKRLEVLKENGYKDIQAVFVDISPETSLSRAKFRYKQGMNEYVKGDGEGGRYLPDRIILDNKTQEGSEYLSKNAENFVALKEKGWFTSARTFNNNVNGRDPVEKSLVNY